MKEKQAATRWTLPKLMSLVSDFFVGAFQALNNDTLCAKAVAEPFTSIQRSNIITASSRNLSVALFRESYGLLRPGDLTDVNIGTAPLSSLLS